MSEYDYEPIPGLPARLPDGEKILWQGAPSWRRLAREAMHVGVVGAYFGVLAAWRLIDAAAASADMGAALAGAGLLLALGGVTVGLLSLYAWLAARATVYTITNKRVVLRIGAAIPKAINVPFKIIGAANLKTGKTGAGDIALALTGSDRIGYLHLWPHARPGRIGQPEPMLRALDDAPAVAILLGEALRAYEAAHPVAVAAISSEPAVTAAPTPRPAAGSSLGGPTPVTA